METIDINKISVAENPRKDFGDLTELTASIKEKGVLQPLIVRPHNGGYVLVAGGRRFKAAKAAGLEKVPVTYTDQDDIGVEEVKLIENIQRKDFNPVEEGQAFKDWMDKTGKGVDTLGQKISKPKLYIERRLELLKLDDIVRTALREGKITLGHGVLLAKLKPTDQKRFLKRTISEKKGVSDLEDSIRYGENSTSLRDAKFDKKGCRGCQFNGGEQALLVDSGSDLKGMCLNKKCFQGKVQAWLKEETERLKKKGVNVLTRAQLEKKYPKAKRVSEYDDDYKKVLKRLENEPEVFALAFDKSYHGDTEKTIYCINPSLRFPKVKGEKLDEKALKEELRQKKLNAKEKLTQRVTDFRRAFLLNNLPRFLKAGEKSVKALAVFSMIRREACTYMSSYEDAAVELLKELGNDEIRAFSKLLSLSDKELDSLLLQCASWRFNKECDEFLFKAANVYGLKMAKEFVITEGYLEMHTKDQLIDLVKELGLKLKLPEKKKEMIKYILSYEKELKGKVPKLMELRKQQ
jgi:ParB/RepB/Spo0J family partition protein